MFETVVTFFLLGALCISVAGLVLYALSEIWFWMDEQERSDR